MIKYDLFNQYKTPLSADSLVNLLLLGEYDLFCK